MKRNQHKEPCQIMTTYIPVSLMEKISKYAESHGMSKSIVVKNAVIEFLKNCSSK